MVPSGSKSVHITRAGSVYIDDFTPRNAGSRDEDEEEEAEAEFEAGDAREDSQGRRQRWRTMRRGGASPRIPVMAGVHARQGAYGGLREAHTKGTASSKVWYSPSAPQCLMTQLVFKSRRIHTRKSAENSVEWISFRVSRQERESNSTIRGLFSDVSALFNDSEHLTAHLTAAHLTAASWVHRSVGGPPPQCGATHAALSLSGLGWTPCTHFRCSDPPASAGEAGTHVQQCIRRRGFQVRAGQT